MDGGYAMRKVPISLCAALLASAFFVAGAAAAPAADAPRTGAEIVKAQCARCHATGVDGAPRIDDRAAWVPRLKRGLDATVLSAIRGHGKMPARGGLADLTDAELRSAILYLFNPAGPPPKPAAPAPLGANQKLVDGLDVYLGMKRMREGIYHVTITLRDRASNAPVDNAQVEVTVTNPVMGADSKALNREGVGRAASYGNDFRVTGREPHVISVQIKRPGSARALETKFDFKG